jgi:hypothetical protein
MQTNNAEDAWNLCIGVSYAACKLIAWAHLVLSHVEYSLRKASSAWGLGSQALAVLI